jgi:hypothetical protein
MRKIVTVSVGIAAAAAIAVTTGCSSSGGDKKPVATIKDLSAGQATSVALSSDFTAALTALKLTPGVIGTAKLDASTGVVSFPITGGNVTLYKKGAVTPYVQGEVDHSGSGLSLTAGATSVELTDFVVHPGNNSNLTATVEVDNKPFATNFDLFTLDGSTLKTPTIANGVATLTGTKVEISAKAAAALNTVFKTTAVKQGLEVGIATLKVGVPSS